NCQADHRPVRSRRRPATPALRSALYPGQPSVNGAGLLPAAFLAAAPALLQALHEAAPRLVPAPLGSGAPPAPAAGLALRQRGTLRPGGALRPGHAETLAADDPAHVAPAGQRPHRARQHDKEAADADEDNLRNHTGEEQAYADHESDRSFDHAALVVDAR